MKKPHLFFILLYAMTLFLPSSAVAGENEPQCIDLLIGKCRKCHYLTRICQNLDKKSKSRWKRSIRNMVKKGAAVTREQEVRIVDCLVGKAADVVEFCNNPPPLSSSPPLKYPDGVKNKP